MLGEWTIDVPQKHVESLMRSFQHGPILDDSGNRALFEKFVARIDGLKVEIFSNEHPPPHFRVKYSGETANYAISDCQQLNGGLKKWHKNIREWHAENREILIETWNSTRPSDCPVGEYREEE